MNRTTTLPKTRIVKECCAGYGLNLIGDKCVPVCSNPCVNGVCIAPEKCSCSHGYGGPMCDISKFF